MRKEIADLQQNIYMKDRILNAVVFETSSGYVLEQLRNKVPAEQITEHLERVTASLRSQESSRGSFSQEGSSSQDAEGSGGQHTHPPAPPAHAGEVTLSDPYPTETSDEEVDTDVEGADAQRVTRWTTVTGDGDIIEHFCRLYFCWEHVSTPTVHKEYFLLDFHRGRTRYCSSLLVNALLAIGSRLSTRVAGHGTVPSREVGEQFFAEAKRLLIAEQKASMTTIQALGLMSLFEARCDRTSEGWFYSRQAMLMALEMGLHRSSEEGNGRRAVRTVTFRGAFMLNQLWSLTLGLLPHASLGVLPLTKHPPTTTQEGEPWVEYTDHPKGRQSESSAAIGSESVHEQICELSQIIHSGLYVLYTPGADLTGGRVITMYERYLDWFNALPELLRLEADATPSTFFMHLLYHFALLMLFFPFIRLRFVTSDILPVRICNIAASSISSLVDTYKQKFTLQYLPTFVPHFLLSSSISQYVSSPAVVLGFATASTSSGVGAAELIREMVHYSPFAQRAFHILRSVARQFDIPIPTIEGEEDDYNLEDEKYLTLDTVDMGFYYPSQDVRAEFQGDNHSFLFAPFPHQGSPFIVKDPAALQANGFQLLR